MKRSMPLVIGKMYMKTTIKTHYTEDTKNFWPCTNKDTTVSRDVEQPEIDARWWAIWYEHLGKPQQFPLKLIICIVYDFAISLLGIYPTDIVSYVHKKTCTRIFTALFIKPQTLNHLSGYINGRIKKINFAETYTLE